MRAFVIDAFTDTAFRGNPAGVVLLDEARDAAWMQDLAAELKHSETAFVTRRDDGAYDLRWFTPAVEVDLCGHATLATTHALSSSGHDVPFRFHTRSGVLRSFVEDDGAIVMDFPAASVEAESVPGLAAALGDEVVGAYRTGGGDVVAELADETAVALLDPDPAMVATVDARGVVVTAAADTDTDRDFVSRFFAPNVGVAEDPVTGSAHCALAPFWSTRLGRSTLVGDQLSSRGGRIGVTVSGDRVSLRGHAVVVLDGWLRV